MLLFVVLPLVIVGVIAALSLVGGSERRTRRYRPGRPYDFAPIWFLARPEQVAGVSGSASGELMAGAGSSAIAAEGISTGTATSGGRAAITPSGSGRAQTPASGSGAVESGARMPVGATGGASDRW